MSRPRQHSKVQAPPRVRGFIPLGYYGETNEPVILNIEEYEAIRLLDYEQLDQVEAAKIMHVSRPTLTRIYLRARQKMATMLTEARQILIEGGKAIYNGTWFVCRECNSQFNNPTEQEIAACPLCDSQEFEPVDDVL